MTDLDGPDSQLAPGPVDPWPVLTPEFRLTWVTRSGFIEHTPVISEEEAEFIASRLRYVRWRLERRFVGPWDAVPEHGNQDRHRADRRHPRVGTSARSGRKQPWRRGRRQGRMTAMISVLGQVVGPEGFKLYFDGWGDPEDVIVLTADSFLRSQPLDLPVYWRHTPDLGTLGGVQYLERSKRFGIVACALLDISPASLGDGDWYWSDGTTCREMSSIFKRAGALRELSLVQRTANCGTSPVVWAEGDLSRGECPAYGPPMSLFMRDVWDRAKEAITDRRYRRAKTLDIIDIDPLDDVSEALTAGKSLAEAAGILARSSTPPTRVGAKSSSAQRVYRHAVGGSVLSFDPSSAA